ncbi:hypothetical protein FACUT_739 [Fusarium acutatum]|uniref:Uncharacterized protein n=1 Tax=Fusarium acutatum TaxID=78861 RepID=A0A8H4K5Y7_9HYPO|nr:hypothetical protein FACUT_739 [Fusarium acutatum]
MSDSDTEILSYPETPPPTAQTIPDYPKTPGKSENNTPSPGTRFGKPLKPPPSRDYRPRAASSSSLPFGGRFSTPHHSRQQVTDFIPPYRVEKRRPALSGHQRAESFERYLSSTRRLTRRNPSNDEIITLGFANGLPPHRGRAFTSTSGSVLRDSPPLPRRQDMEQLEQCVEDLQMASQGESDGPRPSGSCHAVAFSTRATQINTSRCTCEEPVEGASPIVPAGHWLDESD